MAVEQTAEHFDVLIVGAGISGVAAGYHLQANCPGRTHTILERRDQVGGTWELFRYPGVRSDYIQRSIDAFPKQGPKAPWKSYQNYRRNVWTVTYGSIEDGAMEFTTRPAAPFQASTEANLTLSEQAAG